jgi:putative membrane protein
MNKLLLSAKIIFRLLLLVLLTCWLACNGPKNDPKNAAEKQNDEKFTDRDQEKDAHFLVDAAEINYEEMELGELAISNASDPEVKKLGKMMLEEHTKMLADLKQLAKRKNITIPEAVSDHGRRECDRLSKKTERNFDKEYCDKMVKGHKKAISLFEDASKNRHDEEIRAWAFSSLPALSAHLEHSEACRKKYADDAGHPVTQTEDKDTKEKDHTDTKDKDHTAHGHTSKPAKKDW